MNINVINKFAHIFNNDSEYLIINGGIKSGKFYAACQKAIMVCLKDRVKVVIYCSNPKYALNVLLEILGNSTLGLYNSAFGIFTFRNGSDIQLLPYGNINFYPICDYAVVQGADIVSEDTFKDVVIRVKKQIIFTCNPPSQDHWLRKLYEKESCDKIDVDNNGSIFNSVFENE